MDFRVLLFEVPRTEDLVTSPPGVTSPTVSNVWTLVMDLEVMAVDFYVRARNSFVKIILSILLCPDFKSTYTQRFKS